MQGTGNNNRNIHPKSIQFSPDGLSFYAGNETPVRYIRFEEQAADSLADNLADFLAAIPEGERPACVHAIYATKDAVLLPAGCSKEDAELILKMKNAAHGTTLLEQHGDVTVAMSIPEDVFQWLCRYAGSVSFSHPLARGLAIADVYAKEENIDDLISVNRSDRLLFVIVYKEGKLVLGEVFPCDNNADLLYYVKMIVEKFRFTAHTLLCNGFSAENTADFLSVCFDRVEAVPQDLYISV